MLVPLEPLMDVALDPVVDVPVEPITGVLGTTGALLGAVPPVDIVRPNGAGRGVVGLNGSTSGRATSLSGGRFLPARHFLMNRLRCLPT
jgi:hypothetical protein